MMSHLYCITQFYFGFISFFILMIYYLIILLTEEDIYIYIDILLFVQAWVAQTWAVPLWFEASRWTSRFASLKGSSIRLEAKPRVWLCSFKLQSPISACLDVEACCLNSGFVKFRDFNWQSAESTRKLRSPWRNREYTTRFYSALRSFCLNHPVGLCELRGFVGSKGCR